MTSTSRVDLTVPYVEKDAAKALGARWDRAQQTWYVPAGLDLAPFARWLPGDVEAEPDGGQAPDSPGGRGVSLTAFLSRIKAVIHREMDRPEWLRAEISECRQKNGHIYLGLVERNEHGDILAGAKAIVWKDAAGPITAQFREATGDGLRPDIKVLLRARPRFDVLFGLDLIVEAVDPAYTLGDLAAKLAQIRERLKREGLSGLNRSLPAPPDFVRVAVISPETSAGLGDFRREADRLQNAGLCRFDFFPATFQGVEAPRSVLAAVREALFAHPMRAYDSLVLIRGGGSVADLAWLNDLELARAICRAPVPVLTGIGHERDSTILDEVAWRRFDTPSKVALHIAHTIRDHALGALADLERIRAQVGRMLVREGGSLESQRGRLAEQVRQALIRAATEAEHRRIQVHLGASRRAGAMDLTLDHLRRRVADGARTATSGAEVAMERSWEGVAHRASRRLEARRSSIQGLRERISRDAGHQTVLAGKGLGESLDKVVGGARSLCRDAARRVEAVVRQVLATGPEATLRRGYAIARDPQGRPLGSRQEALPHRRLTLQFRDGRVEVENQPSQGGEAA
jgi:exodeoxyribonuclease VII large subunit